MKDSTLKKFLLYMRYKFFSIRKKIIYQLNLNTPKSSENVLNSVEFKFGSYSDVSTMTKEIHDYDTEAKQFAQERLDKGDKIVLGSIDGQVICYGWLMFGQMDLSMRDYISLNDKSAYSYKIFIIESQRGKGILLAYYNFVMSYLLQENANRLIIWIDQRNIPSIKSHGKAGFVPLGSILTIQFMKWNWSFKSGI